MPPLIGKELGSFHHWLIRSLMGWMPHRNGGGTWTYPPLAGGGGGGVMAEAVMQEIKTYFTCPQNAVVQYIATRPIMDLCLAVGGVRGHRF